MAKNTKAARPRSRAKAMTPEAAARIQSTGDQAPSTPAADAGVRAGMQPGAAPQNRNRAPARGKSRGR
jgi:hypothetical protein